MHILPGGLWGALMVGLDGGDAGVPWAGFQATVLAMKTWNWGPDVERGCGLFSVLVVGGTAVWLAAKWVYREGFRSRSPQRKQVKYPPIPDSWREYRRNPVDPELGVETCPECGAEGHYRPTAGSFYVTCPNCNARVYVGPGRDREPLGPPVRDPKDDEPF